MEEMLLESISNLEVSNQALNKGIELAVNRIRHKQQQNLLMREQIQLIQ
jgi:hypothetical protein